MIRYKYNGTGQLADEPSRIWSEQHFAINIDRRAAGRDSGWGDERADGR